MLASAHFHALFSILAASLVWCATGIDQQIASLENHNSPLLQYPTSVTRNISPKSIHSHNDYWRDVPLLSAISLGVSSVEADLWLINGTLYVGHEMAALTETRTFQSLYVQPLIELLDKQNPKDHFTANSTTPNGVFDTSGGTPLQLLVDMKTNGTEQLPAVSAALEPLRKKGYLTTFVNGTMKPSAVLVIGTGNTPLDLIKAMKSRDVFFDAPLTNLVGDPNTTWSSTLSPVASTNYAVAVGWSGIGDISDDQRSKITKFVNDAKGLGITSRFWDTPSYPIFARNAVWQELLNDGATWLNADDLEAASKF